MIAIGDLDRCLPAATDGAIAALNHESARRRAWQRFAHVGRDEDALAIVESELVSAQLLGGVEALDRIEDLARRPDNETATRALVLARIASAAHRFADARTQLAKAAVRGAPVDAVQRQMLSVEQACGANLDAVLDARQRMAKGGRTEDLVPLGALLADLDEFAHADRVYRQAVAAYDDVSPFPLAWTCFQIGMLWGEQVPEPDLDRAAIWYRHAIDYVPSYVKARVHLSEILMRCGDTVEATALLEPVISSGDPEVRWRLADVLTAQGETESARVRIDDARMRYETLLAKHLLAFADHAAEFYAGSGNDLSRARELARVNVANRPIRRAIAQLQAIELSAEAAS